MEPYLLLASIVGPWLAAALLLLGREWATGAIRAVGLIGFALPALIAIFFAQQTGLLSEGGYVFVKSWDTGLSQFGITFTLGLNGLSMPLYLMSGIVGLAAGLHACFAQMQRLRLYVCLLLIMHGGLMGIFCSMDVFFFYLMHELALITSFLMIGIWGTAWRRRTAIEITVYLSVGALLTLIGLIALYVQSDLETFDLEALQMALVRYPLTITVQKHIFGLLLLGMGILVSLFPFHSWAPRGYNAMPTSTAMLHAGVLKKFGLFGLLQIAYPLLEQGALHWNPWVVVLALCNILVIGMITVAQQDLKLMIAYGSVMHMGYAFLGLACFSLLGVQATVLMLFAHGLSVSLLFLLEDFLRRRTQTDTFAELGGLGPQMPWLSACFVAATMASIGLPGFANFWGELAIFTALWSTYPWACAVAAAGILISAIYGLRAAAAIFFGPTHTSATYTDLTPIERLPALLLISTLLLFGIWPRPLGVPIASSNKEALTTRPQAPIKPLKAYE